jgi:Domain of unknown function (DUF1707)/FHA domain
MMPILQFMGGSAADTPEVPGFLRASDAERDQAVDELRKEFVDGRLSQETFIFRMHSALGARNHGQLARLFADLPPRRARPAELAARIRAAFRRRRPSQDDQWPEWEQLPAGPSGTRVRPQTEGVPGLGDQERWSAGVPPVQGHPWSVFTGLGVSGTSRDPGAPAPLVFPPGSGTIFSIGRTHDCDLRIADMSVSRLHAQLVRAQDGWLLSDLGSHNGTRVNGWRVRGPVPVRPGDLVQFGSATFIVQDDPSVT